MRRHRLPRFRRHREARLTRRESADNEPKDPSNRTRDPTVDTTDSSKDHLDPLGNPRPLTLQQSPHERQASQLEYNSVYSEGHDAALLEGAYQPEAADFLPSPPRLPGPLDQRPRPGDLRPALACFVLFWVVSLHDWRAPKGDGLWVSGERVFDHHENWRLLTALFSHADIGHLLANTPLFVIFGWYLYAFFGPWIFPGAALLIGVLSNLATVHFNAPHMQLHGASGMLYGMVALWLVLYMRFATNLKPPVRFMRALGVSLLLLFPTTFEPTTSYMAHAMGFTIGLIVGLIVWPMLRLPTAPGT